MFKLFKKKKKAPIKLPYEFLIVDYTKDAKEIGLQDDMNKKIAFIKNNKEIRSWTYSETILEGLVKGLKIPSFDFTIKGGELPTLVKDIPNIIEYPKAKKNV